LLASHIALDREAVEACAAPGSVPRQESKEFAAEEQALVRGIMLSPDGFA
jgi:hypothetical protein